MGGMTEIDGIARIDECRLQNESVEASNEN